MSYRTAGSARPRGLLRVAVVFFIAMACTATAHAQSQDDRIRALERQVEELRTELAKQTPGSTAELQRRIDLLAEEIQKLKSGETAAAAEGGQYGLGPAASKVYREKHGVSIGGYGEGIYQNFDASNDDGTPSGLKDEIDLLRAIVYVGYKFDDHFVFNSEIEFEHASTEGAGDISVEFAYLDYLAKRGINVRGGLMLMPVGLINELHEPTSFLGARRPETELYIIPSTWREIGAGVFGDIGPFSYRSYVTSSLNAAGFSSEEGIREGRQHGSEAVAEDFGWTGRLDYTGLPGFVAGVSAFVGNTGQGVTTPEGSTIDGSLTLYEAHADWRWRGLQVRALIAKSSLDDVAELNEANGFVGADSIGEDQEGAYVEVGYDFLALRKESKQSLIPFARYETLDTQSSVPAGFERNPANDRRVLTYGLVYRPIAPIVFKLDYQDFHNEADTATDQFNVSFGWIF